MQYQRFDLNACRFPQPSVPMLPTMSRQTLGRGGATPFRPLGFDGNARSFTRGRYALTEACRLAGVGNRAAILLPSYHCLTMLDPAIRLGAPIVLYALQPDLSPDLAALERSLAQSEHPVKAMLLTHYFGFVQALRPIVEFCDHHGITLIEDCSHALFIQADTAGGQNPVMGRAGGYGVASPYKFFASEDGGLLWVNAPGDPQWSPQTPQTLKQELKGIARALQRACDAVALPPVVAGAGPQATPPTVQDALEQSTTTSPCYQPAEEQLPSLACSRWVMRHTNLQRLVERRCQHYLQWASAVAGLPHCRALFAELPADCVPYVFPLFIDHPQTHFFALKQLGLPIWRWDHMAASDCAVAASYRLQVLQLPCHQELTGNQMKWMTGTVQQVMLQDPAGGQN